MTHNKSLFLNQVSQLAPGFGKKEIPLAFFFMIMPNIFFPSFFHPNFPDISLILWINFSFLFHFDSFSTQGNKDVHISFIKYFLPIDNKPSPNYVTYKHRIRVFQTYHPCISCFNAFQSVFTKIYSRYMIS